MCWSGLRVAIKSSSSEPIRVWIVVMGCRPGLYVGIR